MCPLKTEIQPITKRFQYFAMKVLKLLEIISSFVYMMVYGATAQAVFPKVCGK